jgi:hypothetical protein
VRSVDKDLHVAHVSQLGSFDHRDGIGDEVDQQHFVFVAHAQASKRWCGALHIHR